MALSFNAQFIKNQRSKAPLTELAHIISIDIIGFFFAYIHTYVYRVTQKRLFDSECGTQWGERFYKVAISIILLNSVNSIVFPFQLFFTAIRNIHMT